MLGTNVSEIHAYPLRPEGFAEPLFPTAESRRAVMEHFLRSGWLWRASSLERGAGSSAHTRREPAKVRRRRDGRPELVRRCGRRQHRRIVAQVLERWREVRGWWEDDGEDRFLYRLLLADGAVVDLARERVSGEWFLVGVVD